MNNLTPIIKDSFSQYAGAVLQSRALIDDTACLYVYEWISENGCNRIEWKRYGFTLWFNGWRSRAKKKLYYE